MTKTVPTLRDTIAQDLRTQISTGHLKPGTRLPSEPKLATHYKVSTPTIRQALALLQAEGLIEKSHGKGNFVRPLLRRITYTSGARIPLAPDLQTTIRTTNLRARGHLRSLLRVSAGSPLTEFLCLSHDGQCPHSLARIYIPRDLTPAEIPGESSWPQGVASLLPESRPALAEVQESVCARLPTPLEAATLRISSTLAVLTITRVAADTTGRVVEAALLVLPGDRTEAVFTTHHTTEDRRAEG
ncbi:GntR family transcriptional regulator [Streptomyces sp. NPDC000961]|uniref:GntR family transcriptional regulator n=1 Tax=Streptomyces sp. NPDC000961 TaxID=3364541 RepID=UPI0036B75D59